MKESIIYKIFRPLITIFMKLFFKVQIVNKENILKEEGIILCGNHTNNFDCLLVASCTKRNIYFLAKKELFKGLKSILFKSLGTIPVDRNKNNPEALEKTTKILNSKKVVCIFPEGTINKSNDILMQFKLGSVSLASKTQSYIVPFVITGKYKLFKKSIKIEFLKPYKVGKKLLEENKKLMNKIEKKIKEK